VGRERFSLDDCAIIDNMINITNSIKSGIDVMDEAKGWQIKVVPYS
jgi:hypothetical protein